MLSQPATKIFFKTSEPRAAKWVSETLGEIEVERLTESRSPELIGSRKNYAMEIATKPLVMASEIAGLEPLHGFVKQENKVVPVTFAYVEKHSLQPAFIERNMTVREPRLLPSAVVPELPPAVIPPPKAIQAAVEAAPQPAFPLFADPACPEPTQPQPRKSAFKKSDGTGRVWKPLD
jgi:type IV secretory pathway TraG/TraD family ATPase VirD4